MKKNSLRITPWMVLKRGNYLYHFSFWLYGLYYDLKLSKKSLNKTVFNNHEGAYPAQCISYIYLKELVKEIDCSENDVFVDVGCAWGRLLGYLRKKTNIKEFIGVELNDEIAQCAQHSFRNDPHVTIIIGNILDNLPLNGTVFFLFNPFDSTTLSLFLDTIEKKVKHSIRLFYLYPTCREEIDHRHNWKLIRQAQLSPKHMGTLNMCIYEYLANNTFK